MGQFFESRSRYINSFANEKNPNVMESGKTSQFFAPSMASATPSKYCSGLKSSCSVNAGRFIAKSFFNLVFDKGRDVVFREIIEAFNVEYRKYKQIEIVKITTAEPISDALKTVITKQLQDHPNLLGKTVTMESKVDPNIIGGFVVEMNNELYDASIRHDLQLIKKQFVENMYVSKIIAS